MFSQLQLIIAAIALTLVCSLGATIWYLNGKLDNTKRELIIEQTNVATLKDANINMEIQILHVTTLLNEANKDMTKVKNEREENKQVLQDAQRLESVAKKRASLVSRYAVTATERLFTEFETVSKTTKNTVLDTTSN